MNFDMKRERNLCDAVLFPVKCDYLVCGGSSSAEYL